MKKYFEKMALELVQNLYRRLYGVSDDGPYLPPLSFRDEFRSESYIRPYTVPIYTTPVIHQTIDNSAKTTIVNGKNIKNTKNGKNDEDEEKDKKIDNPSLVPVFITLLMTVPSVIYFCVKQMKEDKEIKKIEKKITDLRDMQTINSFNKWKSGYTNYQKAKINTVYGLSASIAGYLAAHLFLHNSPKQFNAFLASMLSSFAFGGYMFYKYLSHDIVKERTNLANVLDNLQNNIYSPIVAPLIEASLTYKNTEYSPEQTLGLESEVNPDPSPFIGPSPRIVLH